MNFKVFFIANFLNKQEIQFKFEMKNNKKKI